MDSSKYTQLLLWRIGGGEMQEADGTQTENLASVDNPLTDRAHEDE